MHEPYAIAFTLFLREILHPLRGWGYQFWSGIAGSFLLGGGIWTGLALGLYKRNCHVHRCWRLSWHTHPDHGHPVCKKHYKQDGSLHNGLEGPNGSPRT